MKRENRYLVFKRSDIDKYLDDEEKKALTNVQLSILEGRGRDGREQLQSVVVEHDWAEYDQVWKMIEARVQGDVVPLLMTRDNPNGWKLEELLERIAKEVEAKSQAIESSDSPMRDVILQNNALITKNLRYAVGVQNSSMASLSQIGPDQGPTGEARI